VIQDGLNPERSCEAESYKKHIKSTFFSIHTISTNIIISCYSSFIIALSINITAN